MATYRLCKVCGDIHDVAQWPDNHREWMPDNRSDLAAPMLIRDSMDAVQSSTARCMTASAAFAGHTAKPV